MVTLPWRSIILAFSSVTSCRIKLWDSLIIPSLTRKSFDACHEGLTGRYSKIRLVRVWLIKGQIGEGMIQGQIGEGKVD